jgi:hypothetical protein
MPLNRRKPPHRHYKPGRRKRDVEHKQVAKTKTNLIQNAF